MEILVVVVIIGVLAALAPGSGGTDVPWSGDLPLFGALAVAMAGAASGLAVYWLQPLSPVRYLEFWLPSLTLALVGLSWLVTTPGGQRGGRANWA